jgi:1,5-anhydro-D-fructose reductase (1,5-anhydro-D-mannitol-forming)
MIPAFRAQPGSNVAWVVSGDEGRAASYAAGHGISSSTADLGRMLADPTVDAVYISSTNEKHRSQALAAIAAGKHVLCEKPLAMTLGDAVEMVRAAADRGVVFATNHHLRNAGSHLAIRDLIQSGRLGEIRSIRIFHAVYLPENLQGWRINDAAAGGGVIPDIVVHDADTVRFHLGEDPAQVVAISGASGMGQGVEDSVMSVWSMPSGAMVETHESFTHRFAGTGIEVHGSDGSIFARSVMTQRPVGEIELMTAEGRQPVPFSDHNLYERAVGKFAEAVAGTGRPAADGIDGVKSLAVALAVREAAERGVRVRVDYGGI